ncbi:MAG: anthranilate synthase component I [Candidatus Lokiarchaeia archaeon]
MFGYKQQNFRNESQPISSRLRVKRFPAACSPTELFLNIHEKYEHAYLLESMEGPKKLAKFSFIGFMPKLIVTAKDGKVTIQDTKSDEKTKIEASDPLEVLEKVLGSKLQNEKFRFEGGAVGYVSYDAVRYWEKLPKLAIDDLEFPDIQMGVYDDGVVFDHIQGETYYFYRDKDRSDELRELIKEPYNPRSLSFTSPKVNIMKNQYEESVEGAKNYIESGDIFQVVLSKRYDFKFKGDLTRFYLALRRINPSPYMYYLKMGERRIVGSSPEMLVRVDGGTVETFPIAGTRPRVEDPAKNRALAEELLSDAKERAEHVMLVDLARNDIGKVSRFGSVHVPEFMEVHQYSHVQHIVSRVVGKLREDHSCFDALRAVFPAGTVSGAPKVRAMEIIEEFEPTRRGPYAGAVGYFSYNGNMDFAITIRTLVANGDKCFIQAGGGIVADSIPEKEWFETEHKLKALQKALELSED